MRRTLAILAICLLLTGIIIVFYQATVHQSVNEVIVVRVVDGDTIEVESETGTSKVRYIGIDTPETKNPRTGIECFGPEASAYNTELVLGERVHLVKDVSETDRYGRLLRYVMLSDGTFVNARLVAEGFARAKAYPPDTRYKVLFADLEQKARLREKGLWGACPND